MGCRNNHFVLRFPLMKTPTREDAEIAWNEHARRNKESLVMVIPNDILPLFRIGWINRWLVEKLTIALSVRNTLIVEAMDSLGSMNPEDLTTFEKQFLKKIKNL